MAKARAHDSAPNHAMQHKLAAILCADVYGYSRLMGEDEEATLHTLTSHRKLIDSSIEKYHGRFVNSAGDSVLAEFASVVEAVNCAVEIQTTVKSANADVPPSRRMEFPHRGQLGRRDGGGQADLWRRRQRRRPPGESRRSWRHLYFGYGPRSRSAQTGVCLRRSW